MRFTRMLFALPIIALMAAFTSFAAPVSLGYPPTVHEVVYSLPDLMVIPEASHVAVLREDQADLSRPRDAHALVYDRDNQPLTKWRFAADGYSHIDPHIAAV
jgi:hypothetical protein